MNVPDFDHFRTVLMRQSGLALGPEKGYLVESRLEAVARTHGLPSAAAVLAAIRSGGSTQLVQASIDAMNTHESLFFRDGAPFEQMARLVIPDLARRMPAGQPIRIWSAACSSGQEPYSIAMLLRENPVLLGGRPAEIAATDLSDVILHKARAGLYSDFEINRGLDPQRRARWMRQTGAQWEVAPEIKAMVRFRQHNLLDGPMLTGGFDVVFCRNVLIYFDREGKTKALANITQSMAAKGWLFLGAAETASGINDQLALTGERGLLQLSCARTPGFIAAVA